MDFFNNLIPSITERIGSAFPNVIAAILIFILGWLVATFLKRLVATLLRKTQIDEKFNEKLKTSFNFEKVLSKLVYYLAMVYTLVLCLDALGMESVLRPLENMLDKVMNYLPNFVLAVLIGSLGYLLAKMASEAISFLTGSIEKLSHKIGWTGELSITKIVKQLVFLFIFIPILIVALEKLEMNAITEPATQMFDTLVTAIPLIIGAALIFTVFFIAGKFVIGAVVELCKNLGVDSLADKMEISQVVGGRSLSSLIGKLLYFFIVFMGVISASSHLGLDQFTDLLQNLMDFSGKILLGLVILVIGNWISVNASRLVSGEGSGITQSIARYAILIIFIAMSLHTMGIAESIVDLAFGLSLGAIAIAAALAFGLGGREAAGKHLDHILSKWRNEK